MKLELDPATLQEEIQALREVLRETEDICRAIKQGEVDAVVVGSSEESKRVLLMSGAYARYRQIVEDMLQGAITATPEGEIVFVNHSFAGMLGEQVIDVVRTPLERWIAREDRAAVRRLLASAGGTPAIDVRLAGAGGSIATVRLALVSASDDFVTLLVTPMPDPDDAEATLEAIRSGAVDALVVGRQVMMLDSARSPYRVLAERMRQGAVSINSAGAIVYANERFVSTVAIPHGRLIGSPLMDLVVEGDRPAFKAMLAAGDNAKANFKLRCHNGERPLVQATMTELDGHMLFLFTDLTEQKRHEASDERTRKFLGMLAHEMRNILGPIGNSVELVKRTQKLDADGEKALGVMERQLERLLGLVEELRRINPKE
jgi:PAS domain S-box-containing protein